MESRNCAANHLTWLWGFGALLFSLYDCQGQPTPLAVKSDHDSRYPRGLMDYMGKARYGLNMRTDCRSETKPDGIAHTPYITITSTSVPVAQ